MPLPAHRAGRTQQSAAGAAVELRDGVPYVRAGLSDGERATQGLFKVSTGGEFGVRLSPAIARVEGAPPGAGEVTAPFRAVSVAGRLFENAPASVAAAAVPGVAGEIGAPIWAQRGFALDFARRRLTLFERAK